MKIKIKFYAHLIFPNTDSMNDMFRSIYIVTDAVNSVAKNFKGEIKYDGDGSESVQYDDVVEFNDLSETHLEAILRLYPFVSIVGGVNPFDEQRRFEAEVKRRENGTESGYKKYGYDRMSQ